LAAVVELKKSGIIVKAVTTARPTLPGGVTYSMLITFQVCGGIVLNKAIAGSEQWMKQVPDDS